MKDITEAIITFLAGTKLPTAAISDALGKTGVIFGIQPLCQPPLYAVGVSHVVHAINSSNWHLHDKIRHAPKGSVVYVHCENCGEYAALGELVSKYCIHHLGAAAVVINGLMRDVGNIRDLPVWAKGITPLGCFNSKPKLTKDQEDLISRIDYDYSGIMACDDSGVVLIHHSIVTEQTLDKLKYLKDRETKWFAAMDRGLSTFEIVCESKC